MIPLHPMVGGLRGHDRQGYSCSILPLLPRRATPLFLAAPWSGLRVQDGPYSVEPEEALRQFLLLIPSP